MPKREVVLLSVKGGRGRQTPSRHIGKAILQNLTDLDIHSFTKEEDPLEGSADDFGVEVKVQSVPKKDKLREKEKAEII